MVFVVFCIKDGGTCFTHPGVNFTWDPSGVIVILRTLTSVIAFGVDKALPSGKLT